MALGGRSVQYDSSEWARHTGAAREWVLGVVDNDVPLTGALADDQVLPDELLTTSGLDLALTPSQRRDLAREELASFTEWEIRFEALVEAGFAAQIVTASDVAGPALTFMLHEMKEETDHQRLFQDLYLQLAPTTRWPVPHRLLAWSYRRAASTVGARPATLFGLVLAGEEMTDAFQRDVIADARSDAYVRRLYSYHCDEEADHVSFARAVYAQCWVQASHVDRMIVRYALPVLIGLLADAMVHPGVYRVAGLPRRQTWWAARQCPRRVRRRQAACARVLETLVESGAIKSARVPRSWRRHVGAGGGT